MSEPQQALLIVDDDPGIQRQLRWTFEKYRVHTASDRESALACVQSEHPAVVTLDLGLRYENWKFVIAEQRSPGTFAIWREPFTHLRIAKIFDLRAAPYERADITSNT